MSLTGHTAWQPRSTPQASANALQLHAFVFAKVESIEIGLRRSTRLASERSDEGTRALIANGSSNAANVQPRPERCDRYTQANQCSPFGEGQASLLVPDSAEGSGARSDNQAPFNERSVTRWIGQQTVGYLLASSVGWNRDIGVRHRELGL